MNINTGKVANCNHLAVFEGIRPRSLRPCQYPAILIKIFMPAMRPLAFKIEDIQHGGVYRVFVRVIGSYENKGLR